MSRVQFYNKTTESKTKAVVKGVRPLIFLAVILTFFMRPFALGLDNSIVSNFLFLSISVIISSAVPPDLYRGKTIFRVMLLFYMLNILSLLITGSFSVKSFFSLIQLFMVFLLFQNREVMRYYFKYLKFFFLLLCLFGVINFILETIYPLDKLLLLKELKYNDGTYTFDLYFPLCWNTMHWFIPGDSVFSGEHIRQYYFFIEPGMVPTFFVAMMYIILNTPNEKAKWPKIALLAIGIFLTFSLGGVIILFSSLCVYMFLGSLGSQSSKKKKFYMFLLAIGLIFLTWYAYNYMPIFGKAYRMELSEQSAESLETHENVPQYIILSVALLCLLGWKLRKYKTNKRCFLTIVFILGIGYLSNYIGYTTLATIFLFWDSEYEYRFVSKGQSERKQQVELIT